MASAKAKAIGLCKSQNQMLHLSLELFPIFWNYVRILGIIVGFFFFFEAAGAAGAAGIRSLGPTAGIRSLGPRRGPGPWDPAGGSGPWDPAGAGAGEVTSCINTMRSGAVAGAGLHLYAM